jgi:hypothetical protein
MDSHIFRIAARSGQVVRNERALAKGSQTGAFRPTTLGEDLARFVSMIAAWAPASGQAA